MQESLVSNAAEKAKEFFEEVGAVLEAELKKKLRRKRATGKIEDSIKSNVFVSKDGTTVGFSFETNWQIDFVEYGQGENKKFVGLASYRFQILNTCSLCFLDCEQNL